MPTIAFSHEISSALVALTTCQHPADKVGGDTCSLCGAVDLRDSGWAQPVMVVRLKLAIEGGQRIGTGYTPDPNPCVDHSLLNR